MGPINPFNRIKREFQKKLFVSRIRESFVESTPSTDRLLLANGSDLVLRANQTDHILLAESYD